MTQWPDAGTIARVTSSASKTHDPAVVVPKTSRRLSPRTGIFRLSLGQERPQVVDGVHPSTALNCSKPWRAWLPGMAWRLA